MSGVMAGTTILAVPAERSTLGTVTLTVNNSCNLDCPHCYLTEAAADAVIGYAIIDSILRSSCDRICIVGKEPLANRRTVEAVEDIVFRASARNKSVSLISNGLNGSLLSNTAVSKLDWIDISLDGGRTSYQQYRGGSWSKLERSLSGLQDRGLKELRVLQMLSSLTVPYLEDMVDSSLALGASILMFSPFRHTRGTRPQSGEAVHPRELLDRLRPYAAVPELRLSFDADYASAFGDISAVLVEAREVFGNKFSYIDQDPISRGIVRVTYDGLVMTPLQAIHTKDYEHCALPLADQDLDMLFHKLARRCLTSTLH